ncbi:hypothetical protein [Micromonospora orduensis]|uniref:hypothetical protein n=1 Tax=Micromonospora orduensis TaxID=1420891 RepID=UPI003401D129
MNKTIDPLAAVHAERTVRELLEQYKVTDPDTDREYEADWSGIAKSITDATEAHFEYRNGQRRLVLVTEWEADPAAHVGKAA